MGFLIQIILSCHSHLPYSAKSFGISIVSSITLISIKIIVLIVPTTITINERTKERLSDYKFGDWTFDNVLNMLMDKVSIEDISEEHIKEHYRRLADFKGITKEEFKSRMKKRISS